MSKSNVVRFSTFVAALVLFLSVGLPTLSAKGDETKTTITVPNATWLAGQEIKPGDYNVSVTETQVVMSRNGKVVATAPVQWKDEANKAPYSTIVSEGNKIKEIHFGGKTKYVQVMAG